MNVVLDGLLLFLNNGQIGNYSKSIVDNLIKYSSLNISIIKDYEIDSNIYEENSVELLLDRKNNNFSNLSNFLENSGCNIYHCMNNGFSIPNGCDFNYILTINNLLPIYHENMCHNDYTSSFFSKLPYGVLNSSYIVCPSISTKEDFLESFSVDEEKIFINYGVISSFYNSCDKLLSSAYIKSKFDIENKFIIFSGDFHERKNLDKCIILFSKLRKYIPNLKFIINSNGYSNQKYMNYLKNISKQVGVLDHVIYMCNLSIMDKANIFNSAILFIDLSIYENVNLDIVEGFSCKTPVLCSDISIYKEYFGDFVFYYNDIFDCVAILNFIKNYKSLDSKIVLDKFSFNSSLRSSLNIYNKFI
ncbi:MAG: glycosyltransferase [Clostridia bacterium]